MVVAAVAAVYSSMHYDYLYSMLMDAKISLACLIYLSFGEKKTDVAIVFTCRYLDS